MSDTTAELWHASFTSFVGISPGASHWHVTLTGPTRSVEIKRLVDDECAAAWNEREHGDYTWTSGWASGRFDTIEQAEAAAVVVFHQEAPAGSLLIRGESASCDPDPPLAGPEQLVAIAAELDRRAEACGRWDRGIDNEAMRQVADEWDAFVEQMFVKRDGRRRDDSAVVVERDGDEWKVSAYVDE